ncbi:3-deoxy-manno-octulosonate cytidylyltransferase [Terrimonas sp.]|uniref:3-deoxy-manno-octulosonate cytidylyltransferase n=1 Tax=Terrimonas sp. TaxID=1914338 RepID=UPI000D523E9E|nr:3-deoxy-manno-octulosonate cytidylyltransferase [Terrimonas sp.]PVD52966.1 3-deoxy-manno-octulosonate cytidylyltransferase [Terrimonas sp.]
MIVGVIPARYGSSRFPGKPLIDIKGKSMIRRVYEQAMKSKLLDDVVAATDDQRIFDHIKAFGGKVLMTGEHHFSGTDRCKEASDKIGEGFNYIINIQGDEPFINPEQIDELAGLLKETDMIELATQITPINDNDTLFDTKEVKVVTDANGYALYFSRSVIPFIKGANIQSWHTQHTYYRHVGMYAYRKDILAKITRMPASSLEEAESLEQLRWMENGLRIKCIVTGYYSCCIDTPEDLQKIHNIIH